MRHVYSHIKALAEVQDERVQPVNERNIAVVHEIFLLRERERFEQIFKLRVLAAWFEDSHDDVILVVVI